MNNELFLTTKSIMYKIISLDCAVYLDDWDEFIVSCLVCADCNRPWNNSRTECFYCGTKNYHVYQCQSCGKLVSLTTATRKCECGGKLTKICLNPDCVSNTDNTLHDFLNGKGGVFEKKSSASMLNEMRCKMCGCKSSIYKAKRFKIVEKLTNECNHDDVVYIKKNNEHDFDVRLNNKTEKYSEIFEIVNDTLGINYDLD